MEVQKAIDVLKTEKKCVTRSDCNRDCFNCDLVMDADDIVSAYDLAIVALQEKQNRDEPKVIDILVAIKSLIKRYERQSQRYRSKEEKLEEREGDLNKYGYWNFGYCGAKVDAYEDMSDDLRDLLESKVPKTEDDH